VPIAGITPGGPLGARLLGGIDVTLRNVSRRGMFFESAVRLLIGSPARLRLRTNDQTWTELVGRVVRCEVCGVPDGRVRYATALQLDADCPVAELAALIGVTSEGQVAIVETPEAIDPVLN
jgi:PilZ domain